MSFGWGANNADLVSVGSTLATAVYLGTEKVWPVYVPTESPWYTPTPGNPGPAILVPWPVGATTCESISISGGAGGTGTGIAGNSPAGGGAGGWYGNRQGLPDTHPSYVKFTAVKIWIEAPPGADGVGGGNFSTAAADGSRLCIAGVKEDGSLSMWHGGSTAGTDGSSPNGRNGGNVPATYAFGGRTYTLASYGAGAGQGGASSNKNGSAGTTPGGGGQSADNGGLTGFSGGNGAHGAAKLYWY